MTQIFSDTIAAIATAPGAGGVGIIRISGANAYRIAQKLSSNQPDLKPRYAHFRAWFAANGDKIDEGLSLYFPAPNSYTGEETIELQGHGGSVVLDWLLAECISHGARLARAGEFTERAFLNGKLDLAQAEAVADLIAAQSRDSVQAAQRSLEGVFSQKIEKLLEKLITLRMWIEAALDFPDEDIDFLADQKLHELAQMVLEQNQHILAQAKHGAVLSEGVRVVLAGVPNRGKSSLMNALAGYEAAIVTPHAGTTRDVLREKLVIDGIPVQILDTAGLRESGDLIEQEGVRRAESALQTADLVFFLLDARHGIQAEDQIILEKINKNLTQNLSQKIIFIHNKCDLANLAPKMWQDDASNWHICLAAKTGLGLEQIGQVLRACLGMQDSSEAGSVFSARRRHVSALENTQSHIEMAIEQLNLGVGELAAQSLLLAQNGLGEITGKFSADDLLGKIFGTFCIGK